MRAPGITSIHYRSITKTVIEALGSITNVRLIRFLYILLLFFYYPISKAANMEEQGLTIRFDENLYKKEKVIQIDGVFSMFITCGNQYGILYRLARNIGFTLTDLDNGKSYKSSNPEMTFSHSGNHIYNKYSKMPCDQIVSEGFSIKLDDVYFKNPPETSISNFELSANYYHESNVLTFKNTPITLKSW